MIKILAVGNSFSQDATALVEFLTDELHVRNLYIGGCSLERHCDMIDTDGDAYEYQHNGVLSVSGGTTLCDALGKEDWDFVTVQQVSGLSGCADSYEPHLTKLLGFVRAHTRAEIVFHQTWAYEADSEHPDFARYGNDRAVMERAIAAASETACRAHGLPVIRAGALIAALRKHATFDPARGGLPLSRDGFHLSLHYGRFAAAAAWIKYFTGKPPAYLSRPDLSPAYALIRDELTAMSEKI